MNDEAIKKALQCCIEKHCTECPIAKESLCMQKLREHALDLFNRQQAEVEQLQRNLKQCENGYSQELHLARCKIEDLKSLCTSEDKLIKELRAEIEQAKSEAIKECVDKYTEMLIDEYHLRTDLQIAGIKRLEQKLLAEMVGGENA